MKKSKDKKPEERSKKRTVEEVNIEVRQLVNEAEQLIQKLLKENAN
jgi:hypothetical protein